VAADIGDTGPAAATNWILGSPTQHAQEHLLLSLYTDEHRLQRLDALTAELRALMAQHGVQELSHHDASAFDHGKVHFGYRDGIAQPRIEGAPGKQAPDMQPASSAGEFLLGAGHVNQFAGNWAGDLLPELCNNATYGAMRIIRQDVAAFEAFLDRSAARLSIDREWVAAKLLGRWRNGVPLTMSPDTAEPSPPIANEQLDNFDYVATPERPMYFDDSEGTRCPVGAHIRRLNPRSALVMGKPHTRRIVRRGMPYGPEWVAGQADDGIERGLIGYFLCGDLEMQFEFLLQIWANADYATSGLRGTRDTILGAQPATGGSFTIRTNTAADPIRLNDLPRWTVTRGCVYCLLPGMGGLRFLAALGR
jgi:deferrochelatase/peroxidase EfeB